jgi:hypothetical protein
MKSIPSEQGTKASTSMYIDNMYDIKFTECEDKLKTVQLTCKDG